MQGDTDEQAWQLVLRGDESAFATVWDRHFPRVLRHLRRLPAGSADAEDLAALTFLEAWRRRHRVRFVDESLLPWLLVTATNLHRNSARARVRYARVLDRAPRPTTAPDPAFVYEHQQVDPAIQSALHELSSREQSLLILVALEGLSVKDAAGAAGIKESTARMRLSRLRSRLQANDQLRAILEGRAL